MALVSAEELDKLTNNQKVYFALFCARQSINLVDVTDADYAYRVIDAINKWINKDISREEYRVAFREFEKNFIPKYEDITTTVDKVTANRISPTMNAIRSIRSAARATAMVVINFEIPRTISMDAYSCAKYASNAVAFEFYDLPLKCHAAREKAELDQKEYYEELLHFEEMFEKVVLT